MSGGGGKQVTYEQSPEQRRIFGYAAPIVQKISQQGLSGQPVWDVPEMTAAPTMPSMGGVMSGVDPYGIQSWNVPGAVAPTAGWYQGMSPEVMAGLNAPYDDARSQMFETLGGTGQLGSARGGFSGAAGAALGEFEANRARDIGLQAWQMTLPGMQQKWAADLEQGQYLAKAQTARDLQLRGEVQQERMGDYQSEMERRLSDYESSLQARGERLESMQYPFTMLPGVMGGTYSSPVVSQRRSSLGQQVGGAAMGALSGWQLSGGSPWGAAIGGLGGLLLG